jgi:hypothetical protein
LQLTSKLIAPHITAEDIIGALSSLTRVKVKLMADINGDGSVDILDISLYRDAYLSYPSSAHRKDGSNSYITPELIYIQT